MNSDNSRNIISGKNDCIEWSMARMTKKGEQECGDVHFIQADDHKILVAAIDGLGHGADAAEASRNTVRTLKTFNNESLISLVNRCHRNLFHTRGVVMSLGLIDCRRRTLSWIGIGNVEGVLLHADPERKNRSESIILRGGVVGYMLPSLQSSMISIGAGDLLIFATDGVRQYFTDEVEAGDSPEKTVKHIADNYFKESDDALILAIRIKEKE